MGCAQSTVASQQELDAGASLHASKANGLTLQAKAYAPAATEGAVEPTYSPHAQVEQHAGVNVSVNRCPFGHGSVGAGPFPGYVHGTHSAICKHGCKPDPALGKYGRENETPRQTLVREALEYQEVYHRDKCTPPGAKEARIQQILAEIEATGSYTHTFDELEHGGRVAWRNAPKCCNRKFWEELRLVDGRDAKTPAEMFEVCLEVLEKASVSCVTTANIAVFRPQTPGTTDGPRVWNNQLIRYAGYSQPGSDKVLGDPAEREFTSFVMEEFGWKPPNGSPGRFDILPVILQARPNEAPQMFEIPSQYVVRVPIRHPTNEMISAMGLQWYAVPAVSCLELSVGGITYTAAPFNGWYADTEIVRNLTDEGRFNLCAEVAACLGLDTKNDTTMWRDRAIVEVNVAVMHSFREAGMGMVDHHTLMRNFYNWWNKERARRGYSPGNWKWIITPVSPTASRCYLELNKMTEYTLKPGFWYAPGWRKYKKAWKGADAPPKTALPPGSPVAADAAAGKALAAAAKVPVVFVYATVTGTTQQYIEAAVNIMEKAGSTQVVLLSVEDFESDSWAATLGAARLIVVASSTYGPGAPPGTASKFLAWLQHAGGEAAAVLQGKPFCVLGFGSSSYPRFCAAADLLHSTLLSVGGAALMPPSKADALAGEEGVVWPWLKQLAEKMQGKGWLESSAVAALVQHLPMNDTDAPIAWKPQYNLFTLKGEGLQAARERGCHWATVVEARELLGSTKDGSSTKLIKFSIENVACGSYYAGDEMAVWAENDPAQVQHFAAKLGITEDTLDDMFLLQKIQDDPDAPEADGSSSLHFPLPNSFRTILTRHAGLTERIQFSALAALGPCAPEDDRLQSLASSYSKYSAWAGDVLPRWADLFSLFPALVGRIPLATFFSVVPQVKPRYYSISSSSAVTPGEVAVCVGLLKYTLHTGEHRQGFCSSFLTSLTPGRRVRFKLVSQPAFRMPFNLAAPVVMVASGTGLAPFRGFWEERVLRLQQEQQLGPGVLVFGCRSQDSDYLFKETLSEMTNMGAISQVLTAFSREKGVPKTYVQDLITQRAADLKPLLQHPRCHVYVCGSSNMAQEVSRAICKLAGKQVHDAIVEQGRYHEDVFGMNITNHQAATKTAKQSLAIKALANAPLAELLARIDGGMDVNAVDEAGSTLLHHACAANRLDLATLLLTRGAVANQVNNFGCTPLTEAAIAGHSTLVAVLQVQGGLRVGPMHKTFYPLHAAVMDEDVQQVEVLLQSGVSPSQHDYLSVSPLHIAVILGNEAIAEKLLAAGADPSNQNRLGMTPLQLAVSHNKPSLAQLLAKYGATMQASNITTAVSAGTGVWSAEGQEGLASLGVSAEDAARVRASWSYASGEAYPDKVQAVLEDLGVQLFLALFDLYPALLGLFPFKDGDGKPILKELKVHGLKVASTLGEVVERLGNTETLDRYVTDLVERHVKYGVELVHYDIVLGAIQSFLGHLLQGKISPEDGAAWGRVLNVIKVVAAREYKAVA